MSQLSFSSFDTSLMVRDAQGRYLLATTDLILEAARQAIEHKMQRGEAFSSPAAVKEYLCAKLAGYEHEVFAVLFLDSQHRLIEYAEMFRGIIDSASVYPRELVKEALRLNAAAVIVSHYVARNIMRLMCPVFLCGRALETWHTAMVSKHWLGT
ncbi:JAB domain-containing protein [Comamonas sp. SCN 65-56]|uniref:JAB domain-containing protein n=1 Tax=Comamonas sp. SCN 65-56 TaxID=1660095 RepID=UPI000A7CB3DB